MAVDPGKSGSRRVSISDIARSAGVTNGAVSQAINGKPGVSEETRERIVRIAREMKWTPNHAARTLRGQSPQSVGLVLARTEEVVGRENFFARFIVGAESALSEADFALQLQMAPDLAAESAIHAKWVAAGRVDGILVLDPRVDDPRLDQLEQLGHPCIVVGSDREGDSLASIHTDDRAYMRVILTYLLRLGHVRIGYVTGDQGFAHVQSRMRLFDELMGDNGAKAAGNFTPKGAKHATQELIRASHRPTAIVYDSELMAISGLNTLAKKGLNVPDDISVVSWEDSPMCEAVNPSLTALNRDAISLGKLAARNLLRLLAHEPIEQPAQNITIVARQSTAPIRSAHP